MEAKSRTLILILSSFLLGIVAGGFVGATYFGGSKRGNRSSQTNIMKEFTKKLKLEGDQPAAVDSILEASRTKFGELRKEYWGSFRNQRDSLRKEIRRVLTPEQNVLYDQYIKEMEEREARYRRENK